MPFWLRRRTCSGSWGSQRDGQHGDGPFVVDGDSSVRHLAAANGGVRSLEGVAQGAVNKARLEIDAAENPADERRAEQQTPIEDGATALGQDSLVARE